MTLNDILDELNRIEIHQYKKKNNIIIFRHNYNQNFVSITLKLNRFYKNQGNGSWECYLSYDINENKLEIHLLERIVIKDYKITLDEFSNKFLNQQFLHKILKLMKKVTTNKRIKINKISLNPNTLKIDLDYDFIISINNRIKL